MRFSAVPFWLLGLSPAVQAFPTVPELSSSLDARHIFSNKPFPCGGYDVKVEKQVGEGSFGVVYEGYIGKDKVAVKRFNEGDNSWQIRNYKLALDLSYSREGGQNLMKVKAICRYRHRDYIVTDWVSGQEMFDAVPSKGLSSESALFSYTNNMLAGMVVMHDDKVAHRDLKPENIMARSSRSNYALKIVDYDMLTDESRSSRGCGTPKYVSPELMLREYSSYNTYKNDVWSLGTIILFMVTGQPPWKGPNEKIPLSLFDEKSSTKRSDIIYKKFSPISGDLADVLADVFQPQDKRLSMRGLAGRIAKVKNFRSSKAKRHSALMAREDAPRQRDGTVCFGGGAPGNETVPVM